ncbi:MAG: AraC family transcriptional regulator [Candidatus Sulfotelmatobacter sp.]
MAVRLLNADRIGPIGVFYDAMSIESVPRAKTQAKSEYVQKIDRVIDYLRGNLDRPVKLAELADVACFSEFHFHRIFRAVSGETLNSFTNRLRLEKAARLLRYSDQSLTDIALDCGFSSSATFSRAFRSGYDTSPSQFRKSGEIKKSKIRKELFPEDEYGLPMSAEEKRAAFPVRLIDIPRKASRLYSGYECLRTGQSTCCPQDSDRMGQIPGCVFARNSFRNDGRRSTRDAKASLSI